MTETHKCAIIVFWRHGNVRGQSTGKFLCWSCYTNQKIFTSRRGIVLILCVSQMNVTMKYFHYRTDIKGLASEVS